MCLLVVVSRLDPGAPLVVGANRDERLDRGALAMTVLDESGPRILGGRDEEAGGTWLAINQHGVVAGLTNRPSPGGRQADKRSRGELPLALARHRDAASAVEDFVARLRPSDYNPAWLLVGDRTSLYALDMTGATDIADSGSDGDRPRVEQLGPGIHILENNPLGDNAPKAAHVRKLLADAGALRGDDLIERLRFVLVDHSVPEDGVPEDGVPEDGVPEDGVPEDGVLGDGVPEETGPPGPARPVETLAACVHTDSYGTRSSTIVRVPAAAGGHPQVLVADGHPCTSPFVDVSGLFEA
jgi:uncharacterized protein with NRDE domain